MSILTTQPRATFSHNPKVAGKSISSWLIANVKSAGYERRGGGRHLHPIFKNIPGDKGFTFAVVRNPYSRMVSWYNYLQQKAGHTEFSEKYSTFEEFVLDYKNAIKRHILPPQVDYAKGVDYTLLYENLEEDFKVIQDFYDCYEPLGWINTSKKVNWEEYYTDDLKRVVEKHFRQDFELYNEVLWSRSSTG